MQKLEALVERLVRLPAASFDPDGVSAVMREMPVDPDSLAPYLFWEPTHYTRNLIHRTDVFELMTICWEVGQRSRIHNHAGQDCWMSVPIGRLAVQNYRVVSLDEPRRHCKLAADSRVEMDPAHPSRVEREMPVHAVMNLPEYGVRAASLHVYSRPYDRCLVYSLEDETYREVPLSFDSEYGRRVVPPPGR